MKRRTNPARDVADLSDLVKRLFGWNRSALMVRATSPIRHPPRRRSSC